VSRLVLTDGLAEHQCFAPALDDRAAGALMPIRDIIM